MNSEKLHNQNGHAEESDSLLTTGQKLAVLEEIDQMTMGTGAALQDALDRMGIRQRQFNEWSHQRHQLEREYQDVIRNGNGAGSVWFRRLSVRHHLVTLLRQYEQDFSADERVVLLEEIRQATGEDPELLDLALDDLGLPRSVYLGWMLDAKERSDQEQGLTPIERKSAPPQPAARYLQEHVDDFRRDERLPSTPEQRVRVLHGVAVADGRRVQPLKRSLNVNSVTLRAWEKRRRGDMKALTQEWQMTLAHAGGEELYVQPLAERIVQDGLDGTDVMKQAAIEQCLQSIHTHAQERLSKRGVPEESYALLVQAPKEVHRVVNAVFPKLRRVDCTEKGPNGFPITVKRTLTHEETEKLLRDIHKEVIAMLEQGYLHKDTYTNWVQFQARHHHTTNGQNNGLAEGPDPQEVIAANMPKRKSKYAAAHALWPEYHANPTTELRNALVEEYLPLVKYLAERIWSRLPEGVELDDLSSAGVFGLMDAIDAFNPDRGVKFETYCVPRIRGAIIDELRNQDWVPRLVRSHAAKLKNAMRELEIDGVFHPDAQTLAAKLDMPVETVETHLTEVATMPELISLNKKWYETDSYKDVTEAETVADARVKDPAREFESDMFIADVMEYALRGFSRFEKELFVLYHIDGFTLKEIADTVGLSESRLSQVHSSLYPMFEQRLQDRIHGRDPRYKDEWDEPASARTEGGS